MSPKALRLLKLERLTLVLKEHRVEGLLSVAWEKQVEQTTQYVGRGRGACSREKRVIQKIRYQITHIARQADTVTALSQRFGWKAFVTNAGPKRLSLQDAVLDYRNEYLIVPHYSMSPKSLNLLKRGHENASPGTRAHPLLASTCA